jgi:serine protease AprX
MKRILSLLTIFAMVSGMFFAAFTDTVVNAKVLDMDSAVKEKVVSVSKTLESGVALINQVKKTSSAVKSNVRTNRKMNTVEIDPELQEKVATVSNFTTIEAVISYEQKPTQSEIDFVQSFGFVTKTYKHLPMLAIKGTSLQMKNLLNSNLEARSIYMNKELQYFMKDSRALIGAESVWSDLGYTGKGVTVAVIDSGIDATHPDLPMGEKVVQNVKFLVGEDLFGNSQFYIEDVENTDTSSGHGTHVAGTIAGLGTASDGLYKGVAPDAKLVGLGTGEAVAVLWSLEAFDYVLDKQEEYGINVISNSWGTTGDYSPNNPTNIASKMCYDRGMTVVFAAGNEGPDDDTLNPYSAAPWVISVAAGEKDGKTLANFSSRGIEGDEFVHPDITAPGVDIIATRATTGAYMNAFIALDALDIEPENVALYTSASGTSMATPHISGVIALMVEANNNITPDTVLNVLQETATEMPGYKYHEVGHGYVNAYAAVEKAEQLGSQDGGTNSYFEEYTWSGMVDPGVTASTLGLTDEVDMSSHDYYEIVVPEGVESMYLKVEWTLVANDIDLSIRNAEGELVGSSGNAASTIEEITVPNIEPGTYTVDVRGYLNASDNYTGTYIFERK